MRKIMPANYVWQGWKRETKCCAREIKTWDAMFSGAEKVAQFFCNLEIKWWAFVNLVTDPKIYFLTDAKFSTLISKTLSLQNSSNWNNCTTLRAIIHVIIRTHSSESSNVRVHNAGHCNSQTRPPLTTMHAKLYATILNISKTALN